MTILNISIIIFILMETANVCILYFKPDSKKGNGVAVFNAWHESKGDENLHLFIQYLSYWVAGAKLIFIVLLLVILVLGSEHLKTATVGVMIFSIATYYWKLHPIIKKLDAADKITPKGYSKGLAFMIAGFLLMFSLALLAHYILV